MTGQPGRESTQVPITVLTGFLGAGKTTLLNALLRLPALGETAVIINEFGDTGIDHLLVDAIEGDTLTLTTGCVCCAARGDLVTALENLARRRLAGQASFGRVVIETTGLADPGPILNSLLLNPELRETYRFGAVLTVVDAFRNAQDLRWSLEAAKQVALADALVLSKLDLVEKDTGPGSTSPIERLSRLNPSAPVLSARDIGEVAAALLASGPFAILRPDHEQAETGAAPARHHRSHEHDHLAGIETLTLRAGRVDPRRFDAFLGLLLTRYGDRLLRLKGLVATTVSPERPALIQVLGHLTHPTRWLDAWPDRDRDTRLVAIVKDLRSEEIAQLWDAFFGLPGIDRPDAAALLARNELGSGLF